VQEVTQRIIEMQSSIASTPKPLD